MITLDALRSALLSDQPYTMLDELVRAELAAGRLTNQIHDELYGMEEAVRATPGFGEDAEEALRDTIDALNGFCRAEFAYKNPPVPPTEEEIAKLPRWTRVAFAVRCARRVVPLYLHFWPSGEQPYRVELETLHHLEQLAADANPHAPFPRNRVSYGTVFHGMPEGAALIASMLGDLVVPILTPTSQVESVIGAVRKAASAAQVVADVNPSIRRDFDHIARLAKWQHWTDDTPVLPEVFGPLWPEGAPPGWPADPDIPQRRGLPIELSSRARILEQMTEDEAVNLFNAINAYYIARTGSRLTMEDLALAAAAVPVEV